MVNRNAFISTLEIADMSIEMQFGTTGVIVECGVWKGGMLAALAEKFPDKSIIGFDSFAGLPAAQPIDGEAAINWQKDVESDIYYDNCRCSEKRFHETLIMAGRNYEVRTGWFKDTIPEFAKRWRPITVLRLDGDWYESTKICIDNLWPLLNYKGVMIIDDYKAWDGCRKAVDEFLEANPSLILDSYNDVYLIYKNH